MLEYKGYIGHVEFDDEADIFHGEVLNTNDVITFQGKNARELKKAFRDSIEVYLNYCQKKGREPNKPFSGKFLVRVTPEDHRNIYIAAKKAGISLNKWIASILSRAAYQN